MGIFRRSLAEDYIDYCNHTLSVCFLLFLAIVTWLLPLSPLLQPQSKAVDPIIMPQATLSASPEPMPTFKAHCWCPVEFTRSMVKYTEAACGSAFNLALRGIDLKSRDIGASLYQLHLDDIPRMGKETSFRPVPTNKKTVSQNSASNPQVDVKLPSTENKEQQERSDNAWRFIHTKTPLALFILAIGLKCPQLVWSLLSSVLGGLNIDQTLMSARAGSGLEKDSRRQLHSDLVGAAARNIRVCSWVASFLYLLLKILMCVAVLAGFLVVRVSLLPQARSLEEDLKTTDYSNGVIRFSSASTPDVENKTTSIDYTDYSPTLLLCDLSVRQLQNVQRFTFQCNFQAERESLQRASPNYNTVRKAQTPLPPLVYPQKVVSLYETLYLFVQTYLAVLLVVNVSSFLTWLLKLVAGPCKRTVASIPNVPLDACLLLHMARENTGPEVVQAFSQPGAWGKDGGKESIALNE